MKPLTYESKMSALSRQIGLYWYCSDYSNGQWSWQYLVLSTSMYKPSVLTNGIRDEDDFEAQEYYDKLVEKFEIKKHPWG